MSVSNSFKTYTCDVCGTEISMEYFEDNLPPYEKYYPVLHKWICLTQYLGERPITQREKRNWVCSKECLHKLKLK